MESFKKQKGQQIKKRRQKIGEEWGTRRWRKLGWKARNEDKKKEENKIYKLNTE